MSIFRLLETITPDIALEILGVSGRSPAPNDADLEVVKTMVLLSVPGEPAFYTDIVIVNGNVVLGHDLLSAICYGGKDVSAWVHRENSFEAQPEEEDIA